MSRYIDVSDLVIPSDENDYDELVAFADKVAEMATGIWSIDIVFCKDCKKHNTHRCHMAFDFVATKDTDFCSYPERSEQ